jgi:hypothetical protein
VEFHVFDTIFDSLEKVWWGRTAMESIEVNIDIVNTNTLKIMGVETLVEDTETLANSLSESFDWSETDSDMSLRGEGGTFANGKAGGIAGHPL